MTTLAAGTNGQVLKIQNGIPVWSATSTGAAHDIFSSDHSDASTTQAVAQGDLIYRDAAGKWVNLARGANNTMLMISGSNPVWNATSSLGIPVYSGWTATSSRRFRQYPHRQWRHRSDHCHCRQYPDPLRCRRLCHPALG
jgi:hypothetical protein